jgi:hypothetical protein
MTETAVEVSRGMRHDPVEASVDPPQQVLVQEVCDGGDHRGLGIGVRAPDGVKP